MKKKTPKKIASPKVYERQPFILHKERLEELFFCGRFQWDRFGNKGEIELLFHCPRLASVFVALPVW
jgi:hypothetical protein